MPKPVPVRGLAMKLARPVLQLLFWLPVELHHFALFLTHHSPFDIWVVRR